MVRLDWLTSQDLHNICARQQPIEYRFSNWEAATIREVHGQDDECHIVIHVDAFETLNFPVCGLEEINRRIRFPDILDEWLEWTG